MAHTPIVNVILNELIPTVTGIPPKVDIFHHVFRSRADLEQSIDPKHKAIRDQALRNVKAQQYGRTNQFEVESRLDGLTEKCQILNRDDIADALQSKRVELSRCSNKWTPEFLSLLLELSDRPAEKTKLEDLDKLNRPDATPLTLTWAEIIADDPFTDEELWKDVSFTPGSSEDEAYVATTPRRKKPLPETRDDSTLDLSSLIVLVDATSLESLKNAQFWFNRSDPADTQIPNSDYQRVLESQLIPEVLSMLQGLPTSLFRIAGHRIRFTGDVKLSEVSPQELESTINAFASTGSWLLHLREYSKEKTNSPVQQSFRESIFREILAFDAHLRNAERNENCPNGPVVISLQQLTVKVDEMTRPLSWLLRIWSELSGSDRPFDCLELLYIHISNAQAVGETEVFECLARIFFECLKKYLKPVRLWMEEGERIAQDESFFIEMSTERTDPSRLWHDVYRLRCDSNGKISSPSFFFPAGRRILNAGKSIVFLRKLGINSCLESSAEEPKLDFETVCGNELEIQMLPFPEMLSASLDFWIESKFGPASSILRQHLLTDCGLERHLDSLAYVYFSRDGVLFQEFADHVFQRLDSKRATWNDRFLLTELAQRVFTPHVNPSHINVQNRSIHGNIRSVKALSHIKFDISLPWPILNIVQRSSLDVYQRVFTLLLQIYRAKYLLRLENAMIRHFGADKMTMNMKQRLIWFADNMQTYLLETVLMPAILRLRDQITNAQDVDTLVEVHEKFITSIETKSLLTKNLKPIYDALISLLDLAVLYSDSRTTYIRSRDEASILDRLKRSYPKTERQRPEQKNHGEDSDSSNDDSEPEAENSTPSSDQYEERLAKINQQFTQLCNFAVAGLRGVSRAGGESSWEMLAERLEWGLPPS